jgi:hypothetical protein
MSILESLVRHRAPPDIRKYLRNHGDDMISNIIVCREPIQKGIDKFINIVTAGKYNRNKKKLKYEDMYHLYLSIENEHNERFRYEKNHVVTITKTGRTGKDCMGVPMTKSIKVSDFIFNGEQQQLKADEFWLYDAVTNNCQVFVMQLLAGNGLLNDKLANFIKQDAEKIIDNNVSKLARFVTDLAGAGDRIIYGKGIVNELQ